MRRRDIFSRCKMTVFRPRRRKNYIARWTNPEDGTRDEQTLGTHIRRDAYQVAADMAERIVNGVSLGNPAWLTFCKLYEEGHMQLRAKSHQRNWAATKFSVEDFMGSPKLEAIIAPRIVKWQVHLRGKGLSVNSVARHSTYLRAALNWAMRYDYLTRVPYIAVTREEVPRSRGISQEEFERILMATPRERPEDAVYWERLLRGLWRVNLRISELVGLSWDQDAPIRIEQVSGFPMIRLAPKAHKSRKARLQVMLPQFWAVCAETPEDDRHGPVLPLPNGRGGNMTPSRAIRVIGDIGRRAGVITNVDAKKTATSHDIGKRTFVRQIDDKLTPAEVHKTMGHAKFDTTMQFYDTRDAVDIATKLWAAAHRESGAPGGAAKDAARHR